MLEKIFGAWIAQGIAVAADLKVADAMAGGPLAIDELARRVDADPEALTRLLRALISEDIFVQRRDGRYALNALGDTCDRTRLFRSQAWLGSSDRRNTVSTGASYSDRLA